MGGWRKSKRVSWASDVNLCQVKLFLSEESPSQVGMGAQDHLLAKTSWSSHHPGVMELNDNLPPGFEGMQPGNFGTVKLSQVPLVTWRCPHKFKVDSAWSVVAGEESTEIESQRQRERKVLEAIYPRQLAIPPNPSALASVEDSFINNQNPPVIPITPIEDEDNTLDTNNNLAISRNDILAMGLRADVVAAAQAILTSIMPKSEQGSFIDRELLLKILSNPKMVKQLLTSHNASSSTQNTPLSSVPHMPTSNHKNMPIIGGQTSQSTTPHMPYVPSFGLPSIRTIGEYNFTPSMHNLPSASTQLIQNSKSPHKNSFDSVNIATNVRNPAHLSRSETTSPSMARSIPFNPPIRNLVASPPVIITPSSPAGVPVVKDINYYKSLIQQHGEERRENVPQFTYQSGLQTYGTSHDTLDAVKSRDSKPNIMKHCIFFNSSRGCRNGVNCPYLHVASPQQKINRIPEVQSAKRMKISREITGT